MEERWFVAWVNMASNDIYEVLIKNKKLEIIVGKMESRPAPSNHFRRY